MIEAQLLKLENARRANRGCEAKAPPSKAAVSFDDFSKMDIRVAKVIAAEKVSKTKKLLKLTVDTGIDKRTIVSGIAEYYTPEEIVGRDVLVLVNLSPRELKGIESQGMILSAEDSEGRLVLVQPMAEISAGSPVK